MNQAVFKLSLNKAFTFTSLLLGLTFASSSAYSGNTFSLRNPAVDYMFGIEGSEVERLRQSHRITASALPPLNSGGPSTPNLSTSALTPPEVQRILYPISSFSVSTLPEVKALHDLAKQKLIERLTHHFEPVPGINLRDEFRKAKTLILESASEPFRRGFYRVNYTYLMADPYLSNHSLDIHQVYPHPVSQQEWTKIKTDLFQALGYSNFDDELFLSLTTNLEYTLGMIIENTYEDEELSEAQITAKKRIKNLYETVNSLPPDQIAEKRFELAAGLAENEERCMTGLQDSMTDLDGVFLGQGHPKDAGDLISRILTDYKMRYVNAFRYLALKSDGVYLRSDPETSTTNLQLIRQLLLYPLGLRGFEEKVFHPEMGTPYAPELQTEYLVRLFLKGGQIPTDKGNKLGWIRIQPYDVQTLLILLQNARTRAFLNRQGTNFLTPGKTGIKVSAKLIAQIIKGHPVLEQSYNDLMIHIGDEWPPLNPYFVQAPSNQNPSNFRLKDQFWLYLLERYGYIVRN